MRMRKPLSVIGALKLVIAPGVGAPRGALPLTWRRVRRTLAREMAPTSPTIHRHSYLALTIRVSTPVTEVTLRSGTVRHLETVHLVRLPRDLEAPAPTAPRTRQALETAGAPSSLLRRTAPKAMPLALIGTRQRETVRPRVGERARLPGAAPVAARAAVAKEQTAAAPAPTGARRRASAPCAGGPALRVPVARDSAQLQAQPRPRRGRDQAAPVMGRWGDKVAAPADPARRAARTAAFCKPAPRASASPARLARPPLPLKWRRAEPEAEASAAKERRPVNAAATAFETPRTAPSVPPAAAAAGGSIDRLVEEVIRRLDRFGRDERLRRGL